MFTRWTTVRCSPSMKQNKADVTVGVVSNAPEKARRFGTVTVDDNSKILDFAEKAETPRKTILSPWASMSSM